MGNIFQKIIKEKRRTDCEIAQKEREGKTCLHQKRYQKKITIAQNKKNFKRLK